MDMSAGQILNVFSSLEIESIIKILKHIPDQRNPNQSGDILNNGFTEHDRIYPAIKKLVIQRINQVCPVKITKLTVGMQLIAHDPYSVHTDFLDKGDAGQGHAYLIPLYTVPESVGKTFTVIFDQHSTSTNLLKDYVSTNPVMPDANAQNIWHLLPPTDPEQYAKYLSVKVLGHWHAGSLIYWDRKLFHSSDDFRLNGIREKSALVLFTSTND